jgi:hypothetical protein
VEFASMNLFVCCRWLALMSLGGLLGCGGSGLVEPELGTVTGTITLDGQPASGVHVIFEPLPTATSDKVTLSAGISSATTDAAGKFEMHYKGGSQRGAAVGKHKVRVMSGAGGGAEGPKTSVVIPMKFNLQSNIERDVAKGENKIDIDLKTK